MLSRWGVLLMKETQLFERRRMQINRDAYAREQKLARELQVAREDAERKKSELTKQENERIQQVIATNSSAFSVNGRSAVPEYSWEYDADIRRELAAMNISGKDIETIMGLLRAYAIPAHPAAMPVRNKTDPLQRGVEVLGEAAKDEFR
jgi:hypothetical protein